MRARLLLPSSLFSSTTAAAAAAAIAIVFVLVFPFTAGVASAQLLPSIPSFKQVSGKYTNAEAGVQITFPDGWTGIEVDKDGSVAAMVVPGGITTGAISTDLLTTMYVMASDKNVVDEPPTSAPPVQTGKVDCTIISTSQRIVSGVVGTESTFECTYYAIAPGIAGQSAKMKSVLVDTDDRWVVAFYMAPSQTYQDNIEKFDQSVETLRVDDAVSVDLAIDGNGSGPAEAAGDGGGPIMLQGSSGSYTVEISWTPADIGQDNTFAIEISDSEGSRVPSTATYDIMLYRGGEHLDETHRAGQTSLIQKYRFNEQGSYTLRIENINGDSGQRVDLPIQVTPEFPAGAVLTLLALAAGGAAAIFATRSGLLPSSFSRA